MSGYLWAQDLNLRYVGSALPEDHHGLFAVGATPDRPHIPRKIVSLPATEDERDPTSVELLRARVALAQARWSDRPIEFRLPVDQPRYDHSAASGALRHAVLGGRRGVDFRSLEGGEDYVAVHIRRPARSNEIGPETHPDRWLGSEWYQELIRKLQTVSEISDLPIRVYSLGEPRSFSGLADLDSVELHLNGDRDADFIELSAARLLVAAPSSFSFNAALVSHGAILARVPWWHHVPAQGRWAHMNQDGDFEVEALQRALLASYALRPRQI